MGILERIFKYDSLGGGRSTIKDDKEHRLDVDVFGWNVRKGDDMYHLSINFKLPFIGKREQYVFTEGDMTDYGLSFPTKILFTSTWGWRGFTIQILGFGFHVWFQDGNF